MKHLILITILVSGLCISFSCLKETQETQIVQADEGVTYMDYDAALRAYNSLDNGRSGLSLPFDFPVSQVTWNPKDSSQISFQIKRIDTVTYIRMTTETIYYQGISWGNYIATRYFSDGTKHISKVFAPMTGPSYVVAPDDNYNQFVISNPNNWTKLKRTKILGKYFDKDCGKIRTRAMYNVTTNSGIAIDEYYDGHNCNSYPFSFQLIY